MDQIKVYEKDFQIRDLASEEQKAAFNVFTNSLAVKMGEKILVVTDEAKLNQEAAIFFEAAKSFSDQIKLVVIPPTGHHGAEPPAELVELLCQQNIILLVTTYSLSHTQARLQASQVGARIASMPGITKDTIIRTLSTDFKQTAHLAKMVTGLLTMAETAHLTSPAGTDVSFSLAGRDGIADTGLVTDPGDFGNLPAGEAFIAPKEGMTRGVLVIDGAFADILIDQPIKVTLETGKAVKIEGGSAAKQVEVMLTTIGPDARNVAELGVGTNKNAKLGSSALEAEKVWGTCHVALGNNRHMGGEVDVPYHDDGVILKPTLQLDEKIILKDGEFVI
jgi:leucyl aminopeptidase (aminopeptidase T)